MLEPVSPAGEDKYEAFWTEVGSNHDTLEPVD